jgi:hypothetical protein
MVSVSAREPIKKKIIGAKRMLSIEWVSLYRYVEEAKRRRAEVGRCTLNYVHPQL